MELNKQQIDDIVNGQCADPFAVFGEHKTANGYQIVTFQPSADAVSVVTEYGERLTMEQKHENGLFRCVNPQSAGQYELAMRNADAAWETRDPYSMPSAIGELDRHLFSEGTHQQLYTILGSHTTTLIGVEGVHFAVWAPNAKRVSVVGEFNQWDGRMHVMRYHPNTGIWDIFIPGIGENSLYKYELLSSDGTTLPLKNDPFAAFFEQAPGNASIVYRSRFAWSDEEYLKKRAERDPLKEPMSVYEVHAGSWQRNSNTESLSYRQLADTLIPYVVENKFTHIELMPITEHPFTGSWGYQPIGLYAPTSRFGKPDDFRYFVDCCHANNIGVIMDWVPAHFPSDEHGLGQFDGTHLYEHADPKQGFHQDWNTLIYNYGRREVANYLYSNAVYWIKEFHLDGLRVDAVASMLYLDYSRDDGEWIPNEHGGRENLEAIRFLQRMNELVHVQGGFTLAEESTSFEGVSRPVYDNGLGFTFKWNMGWMHDTLEYLSKDAAYRKYHHNNLTFGLIYAFSENFLLPFSHDEVVYGKGSMINKMPGDDWQKFANLRSCFAYQFCYPGKKLMFMGSEFAQRSEWQHDAQLDWELLQQSTHAQTLRLVRDLNHLHQSQVALHEQDCDHGGFEWIDCDDTEQSIISFYRYATDRSKSIVTICNFTPVVRHDYQIGVNQEGEYTELLNTDAACYGGSGLGNHGSVIAENVPSHNKPHSISLTLPPLAVLILTNNSASALDSE